MVAEGVVTAVAVEAEEIMAEAVEAAEAEATEVAEKAPSLME